MILNEIRYLVGIHLGFKGLPPAIIAPVQNILSLIDTELSITGFDPGPEVTKQIQRLKEAINLMNPEEADEQAEQEKEADRLLLESVDDDTSSNDSEEDDTADDELRKLLNEDDD